jgi:hypothetical protein
VTAPSSIDPARFLRDQLASALPDLLRQMLTTFINTLMSAEADAICDSGGGGLGTAVLVLVAAALVVRVAGPVLPAAAELVHILLIAAAVILALAAVGVVALIALRLRRTRPGMARVVHRITPAPPRAAAGRAEPQTIEAPREVHVHHHWHGVSADEVAAILARGETQADHD